MEKESGASVRSGILQYICDYDIIELYFLNVRWMCFKGRRDSNEEKMLETDRA